MIPAQKGRVTFRRGSQEFERSGLQLGEAFHTLLRRLGSLSGLLMPPSRFYHARDINIICIICHALTSARHPKIAGCARLGNARWLDSPLATVLSVVRIAVISL